MALDWNKMNTKLDWSKLNTNNSTFKTLEEAKQYAQNNNINYTTDLKEDTPSVKLFNNEPKNIMESGKQAIAKSMAENAEEHQSVGEKFYNNVITPMNEFNSSMVYNIGALPAKSITKLALATGEAIGGAEHPWQRAQEKTNELFGKLENAGGFNKDTTANKAGKVTGQAIQYLGMGNELAKSFGGKVLGNALGYGVTSATNAFANTNDIGDIAMEGALGGAYGTISGLTNKGIVSGIEKIFPATSPLFFGATMNKVGNIAKNVIAGAGGAYAGTATTGEARNIYNALRGREVTKEDWVKPVWSAETGVTTLIGGISGGLSGTMADKQVRAKYIRDVNDLQGKLKIYAEKFNNSIQNGDEQSALDIARISRDELVKFSMNDYGGRTVDQTAMNDLATKWKNYLENSVKYNNYMRSNAYANSNVQAQLSNPELNNIFTQYNGTTAQNSNVQTQPNVTQETPQQNVLQGATSNVEQTITNNVPNALKNVQKQPNIVQSSQNNVQNVLNFEKTGQKSQVTLPNEIRSFVENRNKVAHGLSVQMDNTLNTDGVIVQNQDGTRTIKVNPSSNNAYEFVTMHEMLHDLSGTQEYQELANFVKERAMTHDTFEEAKQTITDKYTKYYQENGLDMSSLDMDIETINDMTAQALGNQEFLNELASKKPNVFMRIWNWIKNVLFDGQKTGKTFSERRADNKYLNELKKKFETAYNTAYKGNRETKYSIQTDNNGNKYVKVDTDQNIFEGKTLKEQKEIAKEYILKNFRERGLIKDNQNINVTRKTANEYTYPKNILNKGIASDKMKASTELNNLLNISQYKYSKPDDGRHSFAKNGWEYYETIFQVGNKTYSGLLNIANDGNKKMLYDITNIKEMNSNISMETESSANSSLSNYSIPSTDGTVNNQYMQNNENNTQGLENSSSFSLPKNNSKIDEIADILNIYEQYKYEDKTSITESIDELEQKISETTDWDTRYDLNAKLKALKNGYNSVYDYLIGREKQRIAENLNYNEHYYDKQLNEKTQKIERQKKLDKEIKEVTPFKRAQYEIIQETNPMFDDEHVGIRSPADIKTFEEVINDEESFQWGDYTKEDALKDLKRNKVRVYSSYPIKNGVFVSTSYEQALEYAGNDRSKVHSKEVAPNRVAWINGDEGQYASVTNERLNKAKSLDNTTSTTNSDIRYSQSDKSWSKYLKEYWDLMPNSTKTFGLPTSEELQAFDNEQSKKAYDSLHMKNESDIRKKTKNGFMLVNEGDTYKRIIFNNNAKAINDTIKMKSEAIVQFNKKIALKEQELAKKKDKTTKVAQNLERQIINLEKRKADTEARLVKQIDMLENRNARINKLKKQVSDDRIPTRKEVRNKIITEKDLENIDLDNAKDINKFIMNNTTPQRVNEKIFDKKTADEINEKFFKPIKHNEADRIRFLNKEREEIINLGIKPKSEEAAAVQMYGEGEWVNLETGESTPYTLENLKRSFPNDWQKIKNASEKIRAKYDNYLESINNKLNEMGYDSIPKRKDYFRHFEEVTSLFDAIGIPSKSDYLPTDLNGLTADLRPGKSFFANALKRTGKKTSYDAIKGIDGYLESASKLIYHTEDIQNLRTLDEYIRGKYGRNADLENLPKVEFEQRIKQIDEGHLSEYSAWLTEYTNNLAGKKSKIDRGMEELCGRRVYKTLNLLKKQVGANLTGFNINTALSNFISAGQGLSSTSKIATLQGLIDTIANIAKNDDFIDKSDFLTTRFGSDKLSKKMWEKASESGQIFMSGTDYFTANLITRSKYHEYLNKGYPEQEAIEKAGEYADRLMAGRGEGDMPNIFNSKMLGIITQFQLENVNQFDSMFHDNFTEDRASEQTKYEAKTWNEKIKSKVAKVNPKFYNGVMSTFVLAELFTAGYAFNKIVKKIGGTGGAFDPIGTVEDFVKDYQKDGIEVASQNLAENILDSIPYLNFATGGGRIPMKDSLPNIYELLTGESDWKNETWKIQNFAMPTGGGQLRKTWQGATTLINGGEYGKRKSNDGEEKEYAKWILDFDNKTPSEKLVTAMQALFFGKYGTAEAKEYLDNGYKGLTTTQTEAYKKVKETGMSAQDFKEIIEKLEKINPKKLDKTGKEVVNSKAKKAEIKEVLNNADITDEQRRILYEIYYKLNVD